MTNFIGREEELSFFNEHYNSKSGELIIVYGRRRIGKTETISHFCADKNPVFFTCTQTEDSNQLKNFSQNTSIYSYAIGFSALVRITISR